VAAGNGAGNYAAIEPRNLNANGGNMSEGKRVQITMVLSVRQIGYLQYIAETRSIQRSDHIRRIIDQHIDSDEAFLLWWRKKQSTQ